MSAERREPAVCSFSSPQGGKDEMTKASVNLQDLRRRIYVKSQMCAISRLPNWCSAGATNKALLPHG
jgi:hypothetical protein